MSNQSKLPTFEGHKVETQRLKLSGKADKDQWVADPHDGDQVVYFIGKGRLGQVNHEFIEDRTIRIEAIKTIDVHVQVDAADTIGSLYADLSAVEVETRRERSGVVTLDTAQEEAAAAAAAASSPGDAVAAARATRTRKPRKATAKKTAK